MTKPPKGITPLEAFYKQFEATCFMKSHDASSYKKTTFYLKPEGTFRIRNKLRNRSREIGRTG
jgi:hypothetical protein